MALGPGPSWSWPSCSSPQPLSPCLPHLCRAAHGWGPKQDSAGSRTPRTPQDRACPEAADGAEVVCVGSRPPAAEHPLPTPLGAFQVGTQEVGLGALGGGGCKLGRGRTEGVGSCWRNLTLGPRTEA